MIKAAMATALEGLDYVYAPSADVAADARYYRDVLGGRVIFAIEAMGARVAMIELTTERPRIVLADHLAGEQPILVYRVARLPDAVAELEGRGWRSDRALEIPQGPCRTFRTPGGHRLAVYERRRPQVEASFEGRLDF
jgi:hypothetical protein